MLLRFEVENFLSMSDRQEFSMIATNLKDSDQPIRSLEALDGVKILPVALIYGANASGKTNLIKAFSFMRSAILSSHSQGNPKGGVPRKPFGLSKSGKNKDTSMQVEFLVNGVRYAFGFTCNDDEFVNEWLYSFPSGKKRRLYERLKDKVEFGATMVGAKKTLVEFMRRNSLFISTATQNDHDELSKIVQFFRDMQYSGSISVSHYMLSDTFKEGEIDSRVISFLNSTGTGVVDLEQKKKQIPDAVKNLNTEMVALVQKFLGNDAAPDFDLSSSEIEIRLLHSGIDGVYPLSLKNESAGTRRLLLMMSAILRALDAGTVVFVDELDASLHSLVADQIIDLFSDPQLNKRNAQLIATIHNTNILEHNYVRRDQIWLCEKDLFGSTKLSSLADYNLRKTDKIEKGYLSGRFGAIPLSGNLEKLISKE